MAIVPVRVQLSRKKGWRMPPNTVRVSRPGPYGNPYTIDSDWVLWVGVALGFMGNRVGRQQAAVALHRYWLTGKPPTPRPIRQGGAISFENSSTGEVREVQADEHVRGLGASFAGLYAEPALPKRPDVSELRGKNLACWCPLDQPCHADVLLELANRGE